MQILRKSLFLAGAALISVATLPLHAQVHNISTATNLFAPSFRTGNDSGNTTWFGWTYGEFYDSYPLTVPGSPNPPYRELNQGAGSIGNNSTYYSVAPHITQDPSTIPTAPSTTFLGGVISSTGGIYSTSTSTPNNPTTIPIILSFPINVAIGASEPGFTTIIIQGHSATGPYGTSAASFSFDSIDGHNPTQFLVGSNANTLGTPIGRGQFWVKYETPGNVTSQSVTFNLPRSFSISGIQVDTLWSPSAYALDTAVIPEPSSGLLLAGGGLALASLRRRAKRS